MENSYDLTQSPDQPKHLLDDIEYTYTQASSNKRFANFVIDRIAIYLFWQALFKFFTRPIAFVLYKTTHNKTVLTFEILLIYAVIYMCFIAVSEAVTKGKTLGKWITGTRAVTDDGAMITPKIALLRTLSRLVPFEIFSAIGKPSYPWHDRWTGTLVIVEKLSNLPPEPL
jgi:uncharacterized RDD family membrane protein YckC